MFTHSLLEEDHIHDQLLAEMRTELTSEDVMHPLESCGLDICTLALDFRKNNGRKSAQIFGMTKAELLAVLHA